MKPWLYFLALGVCFVVYLLYRRGIVITKSVAAVLFFLRTGKTRDRAVLDSCTGWVRHRGRFGETGIYIFTLDFQLSRGDAAVSLLDGKRREILRLDRDSPGGTAELYRENRYDLRWKFKNATGRCVLHWECRPFLP